MKTYKIFCLPSHTFKDRVSGVDLLRIIQPMKALNGYKDKNVQFKVTVFDAAKDPSFDWRDIFTEYDAVYFNYTTNDMGYAVMGTLAQKYHKKLVCDLDDALWLLKNDNASHEVFRKGSWGLQVVTAILNDVSYVTCTNRYLRNVILDNTNKPASKIKVFPNQIDLDLYKYRYSAKKSYPIKIHWFGSSTHFQDIMRTEFVGAMDRLMKEFPNIVFDTTGAFVASFRAKWGQRYVSSFGNTDVIKWINEGYKTYMKDADIVVAVLGEHPYDKSRSDVKFLEYSAAKKPGVYSATRPYLDVVEHGKTGYIAHHEDDWYNYLRALITDIEKRKSIGEAAFEYVEKNRQQKQHIKEYADWFKDILSE